MHTPLVLLFALCSFAFAQPIFDLLSRYPEFFPANGVGAEGVLVVAAVAVVGPPLCLWAGLEWPAQRFGRRFGWVHPLLVALLFTLIVLPPLGRALPVDAWALALTAALASGVAFAVLLLRSQILQRFVALLSLSALVFPALFLSSPGISVLLAPTHGGSQSPGRAAGVPVVLLVLDELPLSALLGEQGEIDRARFPHFAELAAGSHFFRNATTVADGTVHAVPAILSGERVESADRLPTDGSYPSSLFTLLAGSHDIVAHESATRLCPPGVCRALPEPRAEALGLALDLVVVYLHTLLPEPLAEGLPGIRQGWGAFGRESSAELDPSDEAFGGDWLHFVGASLQVDRVDLFRRFVAELEPRARPGLWVLHILLPHPPLQLLPSGRTYAAGPTQGLSRERWSSDPWAALQGWQRFLLQLQFVDRLVGELLDQLRDVGLYDSTLLIVTGDHGSSYRADDNRRALSETNAIDVLTVPIFLKLPRQLLGVVSDAPVETIDILPTIVELLGIDVPDGFAGRSLLSPPLAERARSALSYADRSIHEVGETRGGVEESVARKRASFGASMEGAGFFAIGPHRALVGRSMEAGEQTDSPELERLSALVETSSHWVQGQLEVDGELKAPADLALVVDGTVRAVTRTYLGTNPPRFGALLERAVEADEIEVFSIGPLAR